MVCGTTYFEAGANVGQCLLRHSQHVHAAQLYGLEGHHVNEALVQVGDVLLAGGGVLHLEAGGDVFGLVEAQVDALGRAPGDGAIALLQLEVHQGGLVSAGVHVEH